MIEETHPHADIHTAAGDVEPEQTQPSKAHAEVPATEKRIEALMQWLREVPPNTPGAVAARLFKYPHHKITAGRYQPTPEFYFELREARRRLSEINPEQKPNKKLTNPDPEPVQEEDPLPNDLEPFIKDLLSGQTTPRIIAAQLFVSVKDIQDALPATIILWLRKSLQPFLVDHKEGRITSKEIAEKLNAPLADVENTLSALQEEQNEDKK